MAGGLKLGDHTHTQHLFTGDYIHTTLAYIRRHEESLIHIVIVILSQAKLSNDFGEAVLVSENVNCMLVGTVG